jgi:hypothetical protein
MNIGLGPAVVVAVVASPPPHCVEQPGVVGATVAVLVRSPALVTVPSTLYVATAPTGRATAPATVLLEDPVVSHVPPPVVVHETETDPTVAGTVSATVAVPGPVPVLVTAIVYVIGCPTIYEGESVVFVWVNNGGPTAGVGGVAASPPPH